MYKYEMHCHTSQGSKCGHLSAAEMADFYKKAGYDGLVITDHFFNGNTTVPKELPWAERVKQLQKGYLSALERGKTIGLDVFFGWEVSVDGTDFLTYGLSAEWLTAHEDCDKMRISDYCDSVHADGGYIVQAHPFREAGYIEMIRLLPRKVDAVETINACRTDFENRMADQYADNYSLLKFCGTDNHVGMRESLASLELDFKAESIKDIMKAVMENRHKMRLYNLTDDGILIE